MAVEEWIINLLKIVFVIVAGHIAITRIVPLLNDFLLSFVKNKKSVDSFTSLIDIFVIVLVATKIVEFALNIQNKIIGYVSILGPGLQVLTSVFEYLKWILLALILVIAFKNTKN